MMFKTLSLVSLAAAHFTLNYPTGRGFRDDTEPQAPCGGLNTVNSTRSQFQVSGGQYQINSRHATANVEVHMSTDGGQTFGAAVQSYSITGLGTVCLALPALSGVSAGQEATMQVVFRAGAEDEPLYQCADIVLTNDAVTPAASSCANATNIQIASLVNNGAVAAVAVSGSASASASASGSASGARAPSTASANRSASVSGSRSGAAPTASSAAAAASSARATGAAGVVELTVGSAAVLAAVALVL